MVMNDHCHEGDQAQRARRILGNTALERDGQGKKNTKENGSKKDRKSKLIRQGPKDGDDLIFINSDAKRDAEDSVWRLLGPGTDSELIRPRCALRRDALTLRAGWKHGSRLTSLYKPEEPQ